MEPWEVVKLGTLASFKNGLNYSKENWGKGLKVIGVSNFKNYLYPRFEELDEINPQGVVREEDYLEEDDILFVRSNGNRELIGRCLHVKGLTERLSHSGFTIRLRFLSHRVHIPFFVYVLRSSIIRATLSAYGGGTNINNLNQKILGQLDVPLPTLATQQHIASILSAYDDLIENNKRRIDLLEKMAEEIYREWFVRMRFPGHEKAKLIHGMPETWLIKRLSDFCEHVTDGTHDTPKPKSEGYPLVTGKNLLGGRVDFQNCYFISEQDHIDISKRSGLRKWDILFSNIGTLGSMALVTDKIDYSVKNVIIFKPRNSSHALYLYFLLRQKSSIDLMHAICSGASQQFIGLGVARGFQIFDPGEKLLNAFGNLVEPMQLEINTLHECNDLLAATRDLLLPRLISGKLSVENIELSETSTLDSHKQEVMLSKALHA